MNHLNLVTRFFPILLVFSCISILQASENKSNNLSRQLQKQGAGCSAASAQRELDINNVRTTILNGGDMWWNLSQARYEVPKVGAGQYSKSSLSCGSIWIGGMTNGNIRLAAQTYRQNGNDYYPGPLTISSANITSERCQDFDKIWSVRLTEIDYFRNNPSEWSNPIEDISTWPAHGGVGEAQFIAPFVDVDGNNIYEPSHGDYPAFNQGSANNIPDQMLFWVYNDKGNIHSETQGIPLGLEFQAQAFAYVTNDELNNATFYRTKVINRSNETVDDCVFGQWVDPDLGNYTDDYVECDVTRKLGICYNGDDNDEGVLGYGLNPPSVGITYLEGPKRSDGTEIGLTRFMYCKGGVNDPDGRPTTTEHYWGYLNGRWKDGTPATYGGTGKGGTDTAKYMFPGMTDPEGRAEWTERLVATSPGDRTFLMTSGSFQLLPGAVNNIAIAAVWARAASGGPTGAFDYLKQASDQAEALYHSSISGVNDLSYTFNYRTIAYPNPGKDRLQITDLPKEANQILIYDLTGRLCLSKQLSNDGVVETGLLPEGSYMYQITDKKRNVIGLGKWIKQ